MAAPSPTDNSYLRQLQKYLNVAQTTGKERLWQTIVDAPFTDKLGAINIDLGIVVLLLVNKKDQTIERIALSDTELAKGAVQASAKPFRTIVIPLHSADNIIATCISTGKPQQTSDWKDLFAPALSPQQARFNQSGAGIECSMVYPLKAGDGGALIFSFFQPPENLRAYHTDFAKDYSALVDASLAQS